MKALTVFAAAIVGVVAGPVLAQPSQAELDAANKALAAQYISAHVSCLSGTAVASWTYRESIDITSYRAITVRPDGSTAEATIGCSGDQFTLNGTLLSVSELATYSAATVEQIRIESAIPERKSGAGVPVIDYSALRTLEAAAHSLNTPPPRSGN